MTTDMQFDTVYEYAMVNQFTGVVMRGPSEDRDLLFHDLNEREWKLKGHMAWFFDWDTDQHAPMVCRKRIVHIYRGDWT